MSSPTLQCWQLPRGHLLWALSAPQSETRHQADGHWQKSTLWCELANTEGHRHGFDTSAIGRRQDTSVLCSLVLAQWPALTCGSPPVNLTLWFSAVPVLSSFCLPFPKRACSMTARNGACTFLIPHTALTPATERPYTQSKSQLGLPGCKKKKSGPRLVSNGETLNILTTQSPQPQENESCPATSQTWPTVQQQALLKGLVSRPL